MEQCRNTILIFFKGIFKDKSKYPTLTRMSYCQCRLRSVFSSIFKEFGWSHVALILDRSDLFSWTVGKNLEYGLRKKGLLKFVRELDGNSEDESYHLYLRDASMYARGKCRVKVCTCVYLISFETNIELVFFLFNRDITFVEQC